MNTVLSKCYKSFKDEFNSYMKDIKPSDKLINDTILLLQQEQQRLDSQKKKSKQTRMLSLLATPTLRRYGAFACTVLLSLFAVKLYSSVSIEELPTKIDTVTTTTTTELTTIQNDDNSDFTMFSTDTSYLTESNSLNTTKTDFISSYEDELSPPFEDNTQSISVTSNMSTSGISTITVPSVSQTEVDNTSTNYDNSISMTTIEDGFLHTPDNDITNNTMTLIPTITSNVNHSTVTDVSSNVPTVTTRPIITTTKPDVPISGTSITTTKPPIVTTTDLDINVTNNSSDENIPCTTTASVTIDGNPTITTTPKTDNSLPVISSSTVDPNGQGGNASCGGENGSQESANGACGGSSDEPIEPEQPCTTTMEYPDTATTTEMTSAVYDTSQTSYPCTISSSKITTYKPSEPASDPDEYYTPLDISNFGYSSSYPYTAIRFLLKNDANGYYYNGYLDIIRILQNFPLTEYIPSVGSIVNLGTYDDYCDILIIYDCNYSELCRFSDEFYKTIITDTNIKNELITPLICESFPLPSEHGIEDTQYILDYLIVDNISLNDSIITNVTKKLEYLK